MINAGRSKEGRPTSESVLCTLVEECSAGFSHLGVVTPADMSAPKEWFMRQQNESERHSDGIPQGTEGKK